MGYPTVSFQQFQGLDLLSDPEEVGGNKATDLLNVDFDQPGAVRTRDGLAQYETSGGAAFTEIFPYYTIGSSRLMLTRISGGNVVLDSLTTTGTAITNISSWAGTGVTGYTTLGTPTSSLLFIATFAQLLRKWDGAAIATSTTGKPSYVATTPWDNRLAQAHFPSGAADTPTGANGSDSTVFFSDAGAPETFSANNFIHLRPGDGEQITGIATFGDLMIVSKQTNLFVFYGVSTGSTGDPIFNYRRVSIPARISNMVGNSASFNSLVVGDDGVYFLTNRGLFVTTGGNPTLVSTPMSPIFDGTAASSLAWNGSTVMALKIVKQRILITYTTVDATSLTLVYDTRLGFWTIWSFANPLLAVTGFATSDRGVESVFMSNAGAHLYKLTDGQTSDAGTAITARWKSGVYELGPTGKTAFTRWTRLWGMGSPTVSVFPDRATSDARAAAVTLGTDPAVAEEFHQQSYKGELFAHQFSSTSGAWSVSRVQHDVAMVQS